MICLKKIKKPRHFIPRTTDTQRAFFWKFKTRQTNSASADILAGFGSLFLLHFHNGLKIRCSLAAMEQNAPLFLYEMYQHIFKDAFFISDIIYEQF